MWKSCVKSIIAITVVTENSQEILFNHPLCGCWTFEHSKLKGRGCLNVKINILFTHISKCWLPYSCLCSLVSQWYNWFKQHYITNNSQSHSSIAQAFKNLDMCMFMYATPTHWSSQSCYSSTDDFNDYCSEVMP